MHFFIILLSALLLSGCAAPVLMFGGVAGAGATLSKEKTVGSSLDDTNIWTKIKAAFLQHHKEIEGVLSNVSVEVSEGRVLLTGKAASADDRLKILKLVWEQNGVKEVINEIKLENNEESIGSYSKDVWITAQVKAKLLANKAVRSINYNIETIDSIVYILGVARSEEELSQVISEAENVKNVTKVVNYIKARGEHKISEEESEDRSSEALEKPQKKYQPTEASEPKEIITKKSKSVVEYSEDTDHEIEIGHDSE